MRIKYFLLVLSTLFLFSSYGYADARLEKKLGLDTDRARQVQEIQKKYRRKFSAKRQELHSENEQIRRVLTPEQRNKFEQVIQQRRASVGSSRDTRNF